MKNVKFYLVLFTMIFSLGALAGGKISKDEVAKTVNGMVSAAKERNADKLVSFISKDAKIVIDMPPAMGGKMEVNYQQYHDIMKQGWLIPAEFTYDIKDTKIDIAPNGLKAYVKNITMESIKMSGQLIASSETEQKIEMENVNGKLVVTSIYGKVNMKM